MKVTTEANLAMKRAAVYLGMEDVALAAIDPGSASTGWCIGWLEGGRWVLHSGQGEPSDAAREILALLGSRPIGLLVIEEPIGSTPGRSASIKLPWAAGEMRGRLAAQQVDESYIWKPKQQSWRSVHGFRKEKGGDINLVIHAWAEAKLGVPLRTRTGTPGQIDRANAVALFFASLLVCSMVATGQQPRSSRK